MKLKLFPLQTIQKSLEEEPLRKTRHSRRATNKTERGMTAGSITRLRKKLNRQQNANNCALILRTLFPQCPLITGPRRNKPGWSKGRAEFYEKESLRPGSGSSVSTVTLVFIGKVS